MRKLLARLDQLEQTRRGAPIHQRVIIALDDTDCERQLCALKAGGKLKEEDDFLFVMLCPA